MICPNCGRGPLVCAAPDRLLYACPRCGIHLSADEADRRTPRVLTANEPPTPREQRARFVGARAIDGTVRANRVEFRYFDQEHRDAINYLNSVMGDLFRRGFR